MTQQPFPLGGGYEVDHPLPLGTRVEFRRRLRRVEHAMDPPRPGSRVREWVPTDDDEWAGGIVVGVRTLQNGVVSWGTGDFVFTSHARLRAYLVAFHLFRSPVLVRPVDVRPQLATANPPGAGRG